MLNLQGNLGHYFTIKARHTVHACELLEHKSCPVWSTLAT